jgi:Mg2+-importing ATPase
VLEGPDGPILITKGAPEPILDRCGAYEVDGDCRPLDAGTRARSKAVYEELSGNGFRGVAYRRMPRQSAYAVADEHDLVLAGFITFSDPPMPGAAEALQALRRDGVTV